MKIAIDQQACVAASWLLPCVPAPGALSAHLLSHFDCRRRHSDEYYPSHLRQRSAWKINSTLSLRTRCPKELQQAVGV